VISELRERFSKFLAGDSSALHPNLRAVAFRSVLKNSSDPKQDFDAVMSIYKNVDIVMDQRLSALGSLGAINSKEHIEFLLENVALDADLVRPGDVIGLLNGLRTYSPFASESRDALWQWLLKHWDVLFLKFSSSMMLLSHAVSVCFGAFVGEEHISAVEAWCQGANEETDEAKLKRQDDLKGCQRVLHQTLETVRTYVHSHSY
jgi:aminopeptidase 2